MSNANARPSEKARLMATVDPDAYGAGTYTSDWVKMGDFAGGLRATVLVGDELGASPSPTVDAKLQQATDSGGSGAKDVTGKAITQLGVSDADKQAVINCHEDNLDVQGGFGYVRLSITVAGGTVSLAGLVDGFNARYSEGDDLASVDEVIG